MKKIIIPLLLTSVLMGCQSQSKNAPKCKGTFTTLNYQYDYKNGKGQLVEKDEVEGIEDEENSDR